MAFVRRLPDRWTDFSEVPRIINFSAQSSWQGAEYQEIEASYFGSFDTVVPDFKIAWTLGPMEVRAGGPRKCFARVSPHPVLYLPGDERHGQWQGAERSLLLFVARDLLKTITGCSAHTVDAGGLEQNITKIEHCMRMLRADVSGNSIAGPALGEMLIANIVHATAPDTSSNASLESRGTLICPHGVVQA